MKKTMLKRMCLVTLAVASFGVLTGVPAQAGYSLNPEVKDATPALKQAAEIGVRVYENEAMKNAPDRKSVV